MARKAGQIIARGQSTWLVRVYLGRDPQSGTRKYHNQTLHGSFREAQRFLNLKLQQRDNGRGSQAAVLSLNQLLDQWLTTVVKARVRTRTLKDYEALLKLYIRTRSRRQAHWHAQPNRHPESVCPDVRARLVGPHDRIRQRSPPISASPSNPLEDAG